MTIGMPLLKVFGRMGCGGLILSTGGQVLAANETAHRMVQETFRECGDDLDLLADAGRELIKRLLSKSRTRMALDGENWILVERPGKRPLILGAVPVPLLGEDQPHTVVILIDLDQAPKPNAAVLERLFNLTPAEARLAATLASGATVVEIAKINCVSVGTIRTQLANVFAKTGTGRQAELIMLLGRLAMLV
ncbi:helix-turn-helix transcriptional regulator [Methylobacterium sp. WL12]|nr:helix-turn-helix transcriptional regulator [Methylobacterium sp. WL12]